MRNWFTTQEQSYRLLAFGVPSSSADCYFPYNKLTGLYSNHPKACAGREFGSSTALPCWTFGRLMEIELLCREKQPGMTARLTMTEENLRKTPDNDNSVEGILSLMMSGEFKYDFYKLRR